MTQIDFYVLPDAAARGREHFACRLADIAWRRGRRVYLYAQSPDQAGSLDTLLWTFQAGSFIPHARWPSEWEAQAAVLIGHDGVPDSVHDILINLSDGVPGFFSRFERTMEVVNQEPAVKQAGRERFRYYRDRGYPLQTHNMAAQTEDG
jgi:DNA polymerase-3 subunit chi